MELRRSRIRILVEYLDCYVPTPLTATQDHVFLLDHQFVFSDLGLLWGKFLLVFWGALVSHTLVCSVPGGDHYSFFLSFLSFFLFFSLGVSSLRGCVEMSRYWWVSPHHNKQIQTWTVHASHPVHTFHLSQPVADNVVQHLASAQLVANGGRKTR